MAGLPLIKLAFNSLLYYRKIHAAVILGTAISTMIITGTLMVGDSIESSLEETVHLRLGKTSFLFSGEERYFQADLASRVGQDMETAVCPLLQVEGIASSGGGALKVNGVVVNGITEDFKNIVPDEGNFFLPGKNEALISENLADRLGLDSGDFFLLRIDRLSIVPRNAPFVSGQEDQVSLRVKVADILDAKDLGRFNLRASQTAPFNVFISLPFLQEETGMQNKANRLLFTENPGKQTGDLLTIIRKHWSSEDMALHLDPENGQPKTEIRSGRVFIDPVVVKAIETIDPQPEKILTYFVNSFTHGTKHTPYSFISAGSFSYKGEYAGPGEIFINTWLADDLDAGPGDSLLLSYFVIGPLRNLVEKEAWFRVKAVVPMKGDFADRDLMPDIPGLTDAGNCTDWNTGIPIDLEKIREKDEEYWDEWQGTPKAFIAYEEGMVRWENRFGSVTMIRFNAAGDPEQKLTEILGPTDFGMTISAVKEEGLHAALGGVDFSQLFMGLSFFLLIGGLTLLALLYSLHLENRMGEAGTLRAVGFSRKAVSKILMLEGFMIAMPGILLGGLMAILYNKMIFIGLNTVWSEIVMTSVLHEKIEWSSLLAGMATGLLITWLTIYLNIRSRLRSDPVNLQKKINRKKPLADSGWIRAGAWILFATALFLLGIQITEGGSLNPGVFFAAGGLLLISLLFLAVILLSKGKNPGRGEFTLRDLSMNNLNRKPSRSIRIILLFAVGTFVIISTGLNQKDLYSGAADKKSGTGGYLFYGETTLPVLASLNADTQQFSDSLDTRLKFVQIRKKEGDDASCLNLNRITQPRILGVPSVKFEDRFTFIKMTDDLQKENPWAGLQKTLPGGVIPAVADQTVIQWGLGMKTGDTLTYLDEQGNTLRLKLVGGLANSIFQGNVLIDEKHFLDRFPSSSGTHILLVDGNFNEAGKSARLLEKELRNYGLDLIHTADRLARFNEVENTYLSIFLLLGGLGMILGTVGLGISLARNLSDRRQELGLLKAVGFPDRITVSMIAREHLLLFAAGMLIGTVSAIIAILPSLISDFVDASWQTALIILLIILVNGLIWIFYVTRHYLKKRLTDSLRTE